VKRSSQPGAAQAALTFVRHYTCVWCGNITRLFCEAGDTKIWIDCDACGYPAHWCQNFPCDQCVIPDFPLTDVDVL